MKKIKVLHLCDKLGRSGSSIHGVSQLFSWWWPLFDTKRFDLELVILRSEEKSSQALRSKGVLHHELNCNKFDFFSYREIVKFIWQNSIDILHVHGYGATNIGVFAAQKAGIRSIIHEHFVDPAYPFYQKPFDFFLGKRADKGLAVSHSVKEFMANQRCIPAKNIDVIYNGSPLYSNGDFSPEQSDEEKKRLGIPLDKPVIATIGRIDEQKGNCYFLKAAKKILEEGYDAHFVLFGDGPLLKELKIQCETDAISEHVTFSGYYSNIPLAHSMIDIQVFPSLWEGTPLTMFEGLSFGTPIVSTDVDGLGEILKDGKTALMIPAKSVEPMVKCVVELLGNPTLRKKLSVAAKAESCNYNIAACVQKMEAIYEELVA